MYLDNDDSEEQVMWSDPPALELDVNIRSFTNLFKITLLRRNYAVYHKF